MADGVALAAESAIGVTVHAAEPGPSIERTRRSLMLSSLTDSILVGLIVLGLLALFLPTSNEIALLICAFAVVPLLVAIVTLGLANERVPYLAVGTLVVALLLGTYAVTNLASEGGVSLPLPMVTGLLALSIAPSFAALWSSKTLKADGVAKTKLPCDSIGFVSVEVLLLISVMAVAGLTANHYPIDPRILTGLYVACLLPPVAANWMQARRDGRVPVKRGDKQPDHISGLGASSFILFAIIVVTLGLWAAASGAQATISVYAGLIVLFGLMIAFGVVAFGLPHSQTLSNGLKLLKTCAKPVGWLFSTIDSILVYAIANALGANSASWISRFCLLLGSLVPCAVLGWWLPPPYGLVPLALALIGSIAIARRWAWMEEDRENAMLVRRFEGPHIRVGFSQDLKDETLVGFAMLFMLVPIALRQLHLALGEVAFVIAPEAEKDKLFAWLSFFGTEMAKAVPFVDWTEIYQVNGSSPIHLNDTVIGVGQHVVFGMRVLVDLVLLASFLQAISITQRTKKLKEMFYTERSINRLDPFVEPHEFRKLVRQNGGSFAVNIAEFDAFPVYDPDRLEELKQRNEHADITFVAAALLDRDEMGGVEEQLSREARRAKPDMERCLSLLLELANSPASDIDVGPLKAAHYALNSRASFYPVRSQIVVAIARAPYSGAKINALSEVLIGPGSGVQDSRKEVRQQAMSSLYQPALGGDHTARGSIHHAAKHDPSSALREIASRMVSDNTLW